MPRVRVIQDAAELRKELSKVFFATQQGRIDAKTANSLGVLANILLGILAHEKANTSGAEMSVLAALAVHFDGERRKAGIAPDEVGGMDPALEARLTASDPTPLSTDPRPTEEQEPEPEDATVPRPRLPNRIRRALAA